MHSSSSFARKLCAALIFSAILFFSASPLQSNSKGVNLDIEAQVETGSGLNCVGDGGVCADVPAGGNG